MFKNQLAVCTIAAALTSLTAFVQEDYTRFKSEASVQALGSFVKQTTENGVDQSATNSADLAGLNGLDRVTHRAAPSIGFGWRF